MKMDFGLAKSRNKRINDSHIEKISLFYFAFAKHTRNSMYTVPLNKHIKTPFTDCLDILFMHMEGIDTLLRHARV